MKEQQPIPFIDLGAQYETVKQPLEAAVLSVLRSQQFILGPTVKNFESACEAYCNVPFAMGVSSGTDALLIALMALGIGPGDEVIVPDFSFFATVGSVVRVGATPVFVDIDPATFNMDPAAVSAAITSATKAVIPVHLFGQCADMTSIVAIARKHGIFVIEDAAQAIGASCEAGNAGAIGDIGCFSFFPTKNLGGIGDGGLVTCQDPNLYNRLIQLRNHGSSPKYNHVLVGGNFRLDAIQAAALSVKLNYLDSWIKARREHASHYRASLQGIDGIELPTEVAGNKHVYHQYVIKVPGRRDELRKRLSDAGIGTEIYYPKPLHKQPCFQNAPDDHCPQAQHASESVLALPIFPELTKEQLDRICNAVSELF